MKENLKKGTVIELPIKEIRTENKKSYFIVTYQNREHAIIMFEFQKEDPKTDTMRCVVKEMKDDVPVFVQDFSLLYRRFYSEGNIYPFTVRRDYTELAGGYYEVADMHGFIFRLILYAGKKLREGQRIQCRVKSLIANKLMLELVPDKEIGENRSSYLVKNIIDGLVLPDNMERWLKGYWMNNPAIKKSRESFKGDEEKWILHVIRELDENMDTWVKPGYKYNNLLLDTYFQACLYLLEGSDFLMRYPENERKYGQKILSRAAQNAEAFMQALSLIEEKNHIRHIDIQLTKMKKSGYLFQPDKRLRELMCIFTLEQGLMEQKMQLIFDIILDGNKTHWRNEPFRSAFIEMLDLYIIETRKKIDRMANIEDAEGSRWLEKIIQALAIQLLLATEKDDLDRKLNQSMLYRYLTYVEGSKKEVLLEKSFRCLSETSMSGLGFGWGEVRDLTLMAIKLSGQLQGMADNTSIMQTYQGKKALLQLAEGNLLIRPLEYYAALEPQIPDWMMNWCNTQIWLDEADSNSITMGTKNLLDYQKWWKHMEHHLFNGVANRSLKRKRKYRPEIKDTVMVRINGYDPENPEYLLCTIEDINYEGEGRINIKNFVRYTIRMDMSAFVNSDGKPYLLQAQVIGVNAKGIFEFTMRDGIWDYIRQCLKVGNMTRCVVMEKYKGYYLCISEYGYSLHVEITSNMPQLPIGGYIEAVVDEVKNNGTVEASFAQQILENFKVQDAFANLIDGYAEERVYEEEDDKEDLQMEIPLDESYVIELVHILDRKAILEPDYVKTYNLLNIARLIALLVEKDEIAGYYDERMKLLKMFQAFAINGTVDNAKLMEQSKVNGDMIANYPLLQTRLLELQCISCMDVEGKNDFLWEVMSKTCNARLQKIAKLVLSYNLLIGFGMFEEKEAIRVKLNEILNIEMKTERPRYFGREDLHTEFKSSLVYPASCNMQPDLKAQTHVIMKVICGFLNAEGGTLYIGVNNEGVACGIEDDLAYFKNSSMDSFDLYVRNMIVKKMGVRANAYVKVSYPDAGKKTVYAIEIKPSPYPVKLDDIHYVRQGSSTWPVMGEDLESFLEQRDAEIQRLGAVVVEPAEQAVEVPELEVEEKTAVKEITYHDDTQISTSCIRRNPLHSWEDGFGEDTLCYLHLLPKYGYMLTDDECWEETLLSLSVQQCEKDGYIILVYKSGRIVKVPVSELLDKTLRKSYKRSDAEELFFACPAKEDDALLTIVTDNNDNHCYRLDDIANLREGNMSDKGELLSNVYLKSVVQCEIIPKKHIGDLKKIHNLRSTNLGNMLTEQWAPKELATLRKLGVLKDE